MLAKPHKLALIIKLIICIPKQQGNLLKIQGKNPDVGIIITCYDFIYIFNI